MQPAVVAVRGHAEDHVRPDRANQAHVVRRDLVASPLLERLFETERVAEIDSAGEVLLGAVEAVQRGQLFRPQHAERPRRSRGRFRSALRCLASRSRAPCGIPARDSASPAGRCPHRLDARWLPSRCRRWRGGAAPARARHDPAARRPARPASGHGEQRRRWPTASATARAIGRARFIVTAILWQERQTGRIGRTGRGSYRPAYPAPPAFPDPRISS